MTALNEAECLARELRPSDDVIALKGKSYEEAGVKLQRLCDFILSGSLKREIENAALYLPVNKINDLQLASITRLIATLKWSHHADITVRRDGQDHHFEADWLKHILQPPVQKENGE